MTARERALQKIREAIQELRGLGTIDDLPDWVWEEVWHLKGVRRNQEGYYDVGCDLCQGDHGIAIRARLFGPGWPVVFEVYRYRRSWPLKDRVREAWRALRGLPYEDEVLQNADSLVRLRDFLNRVFAYDAPEPDATEGRPPRGASNGSAALEKDRDGGSLHG